MITLTYFRPVSVLAQTLPPLGGVLVGGAITGFVQWQQRREDWRDRSIDRLSDAVIDVQTDGVAWMRDAELLLNVYAEEMSGDGDDPLAEHPRFEAYTRSGVRFQSSITRTRLLADGELYEALDKLSASFRALGLDAFLAVNPEGEASVAARAADFKHKLFETHMLFNEFLRTAVRQLRIERSK